VAFVAGPMAQRVLFIMAELGGDADPFMLHHSMPRSLKRNGGSCANLAACPSGCSGEGAITLAAALNDRKIPTRRERDTAHIVASRLIPEPAMVFALASRTSPNFPTVSIKAKNAKLGPKLEPRPPLSAPVALEG
jgi:hypothetical protein